MAVPLKSPRDSGVPAVWRRAAQPQALIAVAVVVVMVITPVAFETPVGVAMATILYMIAATVAGIGLIAGLANDGRPSVRLAGIASLAAMPALVSLAINAGRPALLPHVPGGLIAFLAGAVILSFLLVASRRAPSLPAIGWRLLVILGAPLAVMAILQTSLGEWPILDEIGDDPFISASFPGRAAAVFGHPIVYGAVAAVLALVAIRLGGPWAVPLIALNAAGMVLSGSRSAWLAFGAGIIYLLVVWLRSGHSLNRSAVLRTLGAGALTITLVLAPSAVACVLPDSPRGVECSAFLPSETAPNGEDDRGILEASSGYSGRYRLQQWTAAWGLITSSPLQLLFGHGPGSSVLLFETEQLGVIPGPKTFDNMYVTLWYEQGLLGIATLAFLALLAVRSSRSSIVWLVLIALMVNVAFYDGFRWPAIVALAVLAGATALSRVGGAVAGGGTSEVPR